MIYNNGNRKNITDISDLRPLFATKVANYSEMYPF